MNIGLLRGRRLRKGWFKIHGVQDGDRTLEQQLRGLAPLVYNISGKSVVDFGCAEGLIAKHLLECGAKSVVGFEIVEDHVVEAKRQCADFMHSPPMAVFHCRDLHDYVGIESMIKAPVDVVLMLALLHKLREPSDFLAYVVEKLAPRELVIKTAGATPGYVMHPRSKDRRFDLVKLLRGEYDLVDRTDGPLDEWTGYFKRVVE